MTGLNWLQKTTGRMLLKKQLAKNGVPKNLISGELVDDLFENIEGVCIANQIAPTGETTTTVMVQHIEHAAGHLGSLHRGQGGMGKLLDERMLELMKKHGISVG
jgi:hypothetical protein